MARPSTPPLLYLDAAAVEAAMPPVDERLRLAEATMLALVADAQLPPKIAVHPRPPGSFGHAMPAYLGPGGAADAVEDLLGIKWVTGYPTNSALGLPAIHATVILDDAATGVAVAILDGGPITAQRTAAVSGVAIRHWAPPRHGAPLRAAILGAGVQARSHLAVLAALLPGVELSLFDRHPDRAAAVAQLAAATPGIAAARASASAREAVAEADVVVTGVTFGAPRQTLGVEHLRPSALIVPIDYDTTCAAAVAREADLFVVDDRAQFLAIRAGGAFTDYPDPGATFGEAILAGAPRPAGRVVAAHLGVGLADVMFAAAITARARAMGLGQVLSR